MIEERSFEPILDADLRKFAELAFADRASFFARHPDRKNVFLCSALCQGAAQHFVDRVNGVKDIDLWSFYAKLDSGPHFAARRRATRDFGVSKFGVHPDDAKGGYKGRRVDLLGRSISHAQDDDVVDSLLRYLREAVTSSAWHLSRKPVVLLEPEHLRGKVVWLGQQA